MNAPENIFIDCKVKIGKIIQPLIAPESLRKDIIIAPSYKK